MSSLLRFCSRCVMDGSAPELVLDENGVCNFCHQAQRELSQVRSAQHNLPILIEKIKSDGMGKKYDCVIGLSGGVDSSYLLHQAVLYGLRPFCFSVDNGWQSDKAQENVMKLVEGLKVRFFRYTIDLPRFYDLQSAFIKAGQKNLEIPTDHVLMAASYDMANRYGIQWILSGGNVATESIMPPSWGYNARDLVHIKSVYSWATGERLRGLPMCSLLQWNWYKWIKGIRTCYLLDYEEYNREHAITLLKEKYNWQNYGQKHEENTYTWWFQSFYLFEKFGIDKRKAHFSSLINSGQMTRKEAMDLLADRPVYPELGIEKSALSYEAKPYTAFATDEKLFQCISNVIKTIRASIQ